MRCKNQNPTADTLSWVDAPMPALLRLAWPIIVSMLSYSVMTLVDTLFVSPLGAAALSGVGLGSTSIFILAAMPMGLLGGVKVLSSQAIGAGKPREVNAYMGAGLLWALVFGVRVADSKPVSDRNLGVLGVCGRAVGGGCLGLVVHLHRQPALGVGASTHWRAPNAGVRRLDRMVSSKLPLLLVGLGSDAVDAVGVVDEGA